MNQNLPTGETMSDGDDSGAESNVTLPASTFATTPKEGERLTFCVTGGDKENVTGYWMASKPEESDDADPEDWDDGARKSVKNPMEEI
jgi:hypothetical protein